MSPQFRLQQRKSILGNLVRLNISKSGVSASIGVPGFGITIPLVGKMHRHPRVHAGIPGTGMSVSETIGDGK